MKAEVKALRPVERFTGEHVLYRFFGEDGALLYLGITNNLNGRINDHRSKPWWPEVVNATVEFRDTREELEAAESAAIRSERPRYNIAGKLPEIPAQPGRSHRPDDVTIYKDAARIFDGLVRGVTIRDILVQSAKEPNRVHMEAHISLTAHRVNAFIDSPYPCRRGGAVLMMIRTLLAEAIQRRDKGAGGR